MAPGRKKKESTKKKKKNTKLGWAAGRSGCLPLVVEMGWFFFCVGVLFGKYGRY